MKNLHLSSIIFSIVILSCSVTGCGSKEVEIYKTKHKCSETEISSVKDLIFEPGASPEKVGKKLKDFCLCEDGDDYVAYVPVKWKDFSGEIKIEFNADKEFQNWKYMKNYSDYKNTYHDYRVIFNQISDELGKPDGEQKGDGGYILDGWRTEHKDSDGSTYAVGLCLNQSDNGYSYYIYFDYNW